MGKDEGEVGTRIGIRPIVFYRFHLCEKKPFDFISFIHKKGVTLQSLRKISNI